MLVKIVPSHDPFDPKGQIHLPAGKEADAIRDGIQHVEKAARAAVFDPLRPAFARGFIREAVSYRFGSVPLYLGLPIINSELTLTHIQLDVELKEEDQECHRILCGPGLDPQIAHGFDQQARQSSLDTHWAVYGVGDFRGPLPPKLQNLMR